MNNYTHRVEGDYNLDGKIVKLEGKASINEHKGSIDMILSEPDKTYELSGDIIFLDDVTILDIMETKPDSKDSIYDSDPKIYFNVTSTQGGFNATSYLGERKEVVVARPSDMDLENKTVDELVNDALDLGSLLDKGYTTRLTFTEIPGRVNKMYFLN